MFGLFGKPSKEKFAALVLRKIKEKGGPADFVFVQEEFEIRRGATRGFLGNTYDSFCHAKGQQPDVILNNFVSAFTIPLDLSSSSLDDVRHDFATVVRERALFSFTSLLWRLDGINGPPTVQAEPISDWFARAVVVDAPGHMLLVNEEHIRGWGCSSDEVYAVGVEKLRNSKPPAFTENCGVYQGTWNDDYDSSRILVPGLFDDLPITGESVIAIPNRLTLLVADSEKPETVRRMLVLAEEIVRTHPRRQNPAPLVVREGYVSDYSVSEGSPIFNDVARAKRVAALLYCSEQKESLERLYEKECKEYFVASYSLNQLDSGKYIASAVWTKGVPTLLPVCDEIIFVDLDLPKGETVVGRVAWIRVWPELSEQMMDTQMFPARFYVSDFPSAVQIRRLVDIPS